MKSTNNMESINNRTCDVLYMKLRIIHN